MRYKSILLMTFYVLALGSLGAKNASYYFNIYYYTKLDRGGPIIDDPDEQNLRCYLDFKQANRADVISSLLKLAIGYLQLVSINELRFAISKI
jgi:hypothetical protein